MSAVGHLWTKAHQRVAMNYGVMQIMIRGR